MASLQDFMVSKVRVKLVEAFLSNPEEMFYIRQLTRDLEEEINAVRRELLGMKERGMVKEEKRGNRIYYTFNRSYLFHKELMSMVGKTTGLGSALAHSVAKLGKVKFIMLSGRFARRMPRIKDTVDLLIVGDVIMPQLTEVVREQEAKLNREINYTVMTLEELNYRKTHNDPFIGRILQGSRVMILGDEEDLVS